MLIQQYIETVPLPSDAPTDLHHFIHEDVHLAYSPTTGKCYRLAFTSRSRDLKSAEWKLIKPGTLDSTYTRTKINGSTHQLHRVIAQHFMNDGKPLNSTDHVDHRKHADGTHIQDAFENLRITNTRGNGANRRDGSSHFAGVHWNTQRNKWHAQIIINKQKKHIGLFHSELEAARAYIETGEAQGYDMTVARERFHSIAGYAKF